MRRLYKIRQDRLLHFAAGYLVGCAVFFLHPLLIVGAAALVGFLKEVHDSRQPFNFFDWQDLIATALGAVPLAIVKGAWLWL